MVYISIYSCIRYMYVLHFRLAQESGIFIPLHASSRPCKVSFVHMLHSYLRVKSNFSERFCYLWWIIFLPFLSPSLIALSAQSVFQRREGVKVFRLGQVRSWLVKQTNQTRNICWPPTSSGQLFLEIKNVRSRENKIRIIILLFFIYHYHYFFLNHCKILIICNTFIHLYFFTSRLTMNKVDSFNI